MPRKLTFKFYKLIVLPPPANYSGLSAQVLSYQPRNVGCQGVFFENFHYLYMAERTVIKIFFEGFIAAIY